MRFAKFVGAFAVLSATGALASNWPMFRGSPDLRGTTGENVPAKPALLWTFKTGAAVRSTAAIVGNQIFIGSNDGKVYSLNVTNGEKLWSFKTSGPVESSPLVLGGKVFVGSVDGFLYALDAKSGDQLWKYETADKILGAPNWFADEGRARHSVRAADQSDNGAQRTDAPYQTRTNILIGSYDFKLHCVDAATGKSNWVFESSNYINGSPAVADGVTVFGGCDAVLHIISLADGKKIKEIEAGAYVAASVAIRDGRAYFGHFENAFQCVDLKKDSGTNSPIVWQFRDREFPFFSSPAVTKERVVFGGRDKQLHCVRADDGKPLWTFSARGKIDSSPVIAGDKVVVGSDDGRVYIVSLNGGKELWSYEIGQPIGSSPAVANGKFVIGSDDGNVYCFGEKRK